MYVSAYIVPGDDYQTVMEYYDGKGVTFYVSDNHLTGFMFNLLIDGETYTYEVKISDIGTTSIPYEFLIESEETGDFAWLNDVIGTWSSAMKDTILVINSSNDITLNGEQITNLTTYVNSLDQHVLDFYVGETNYTATFSQWQGEYDEVRYNNINGIIFGIGEQNGIPDEIAKLIIQTREYDDIIEQLKSDKITKRNAIEELRKLYMNISENVATKDFIMNNGEIVITDYSEQIKNQQDREEER